ncbi:MAG: prolipoprotein diacylglyceryl transferase [Deltaproteobacteria bacterium]|nr:prolipoprotein diacylglyceryl transferase [Deltaproteobacteria bacterium]
MIPYWDYDPLLVLGPLKVHAFGLLVVTGVLVGSWVTRRHAIARGVDVKHLRDALTWLLVSGFVGAHLFAVIAYEPARTLADPLRLIMFWDGLSSTGGFFGAFIGLGQYCRKKKNAFGPIADVVALGLLVGWLFGRLGCFTAHDHPGLTTDFFLAVNYPRHLGGPRHDLGFYEFLVTLALFGVFEIVRRRPMKPGSLAALIGVAYAPPRFALDFLRLAPGDHPTLHSDIRYAGLTPAQYVCIALLIGCGAALAVIVHRQEYPAAPKSL